MKKIITPILVFLTLISYSQSTVVNEKISELNDLFKKGKFQKVEILANEILNNQYGTLNNEEKSNTLNLFTALLTWDKYENKDYKLGHKYLLELLDLWKNGMGSFPDKETKVLKITNFISDLENKYPELKENKSISATTNEFKTNSPTNDYNTESKVSLSEIKIVNEAQNDKTVTLTVSGTGKTLEEARLNALRSAIEQAFGAFISSKTEILNDNLVKDEIVSVASGNVEKYDVVSQIEIPNNGFAITLNATVSISKLTSFAQSKGVTVEFKGGMFAMNIKLKELNEKAEYKAIRNLSATSLEMLQESYDYNLTVSEPKFESENNNYKINFRISTVENKNYQSFINYFISTIKKIALTEAEASEIKSIGKETYSFIIDDKLYQLRNIYSMLYLHHFFIGASLITTNSSVIYTDSGEIIKIRSRAESITNAKINNDRDLIFLFEDVTTDNKDYYNSDKFLSSDWTIFQDGKDLYERSKLTLNSKFKPTDVCFNKKFSLTELEKISSFSIKKIGFFDFIKNRNLYVMNFNRNDYSDEIFRDQNGEIIENPDRDDLYTYESCKN